MTLEELIRDRIAKGEMTHLSIWPDHKTKGWGATYTPSHEFGTSIAFDADPVTAAVKAIESPKTKRVRSKHVDYTRGQDQSEPEPTPEAAAGSTADPQADAGTNWFRHSGP